MSAPVVEAVCDDGDGFGAALADGDQALLDQYYPSDDTRGSAMRERWAVTPAGELVPVKWPAGGPAEPRWIREAEPPVTRCEPWCTDRKAGWPAGGAWSEPLGDRYCFGEERTVAASLHGPAEQFTAYAQLRHVTGCRSVLVGLQDGPPLEMTPEEAVMVSRGMVLAALELDPGVLDRLGYGRPS